MSIKITEWPEFETRTATAIVVIAPGRHATVVSGMATPRVHARRKQRKLPLVEQGSSSP